VRTALVEDELSVGIVGSGPAAIGAAWDLAEAGASVTVYEKDDVPGGLLAWGIPAFTLPTNVAGRPWHQLQEAGVRVECGHPVDPDELDDLLEKHDAVILANGASVPLRLPVPGSDLAGVIDATELLKRAHTAIGGDEVSPGLAGLLESLSVRARQEGPLVLVLGAGNTAMDVARSVRRLGGRAMCVDWFDERFALARPNELAEARAEGVEIRFGTTLVEVRGEDGRVASAKLAHTSQRAADQLPKVIKGSEEIIEVDLVVMAMGYRVDPVFGARAPGTPVRKEASGIPDRRWSASGVLANPAPPFARGRPVGRLALGREVGLEASGWPHSDRVWVVGDALIGPATVVEAMAHGRRAQHVDAISRPRRPDRGPEGAQRVLVAYESRGGRTERAAGRLASLLTESCDVVALPMSKVGRAELSRADLVVFATWVEGMVVARVRPAKAARAWLEKLPSLAGKKAAVLCTYGVSPRGAVPELRGMLEQKGANVVAEAAVNGRDLETGARELAEALAAARAIDPPIR
jgi:NADPH-dependent glutamate synthase beta subunit-like oxidoreductase/flavodoxin